MQTGTYEKMLSDMNKGVYNFTKNGKCSQCGECCSNILPISEKETRIIRRYIKHNKIKEQKHFSAFTIDFICPFLDMGKKAKKCTIYAVRPAICRYFKCDEPQGALMHKELYDDVRKAVDMRATFFSR